MEYETIDADQIDDIMAGREAASARGLADVHNGGDVGGADCGPSVTPANAPIQVGPPGALTHLLRASLVTRLPTLVRCSATAATRRSLDRRRMMGIINVTPDSFSDGGRFRDGRAAFAHCAARCSRRRDLIDVGGESTRPGAAPVKLEEELARVVP